MKILITGGPGQISYSLVPFLCEREFLQAKKNLIYLLVEIPPAMKNLMDFLKNLKIQLF
ncbi:MAG: hypothetical protein CM15mP127_14720 [Gammaproteobacteria bacterium]|nr:MAG: hypothetical protein CM15mP127_14720 [Gammaproteobacteria bacterium]